MSSSGKNGHNPPLDEERLEDFTVVNEADVSGSENGTEDDKEGVPISKDQWPPEQQTPRTYTDEDLKPTVRDPRCREDWPLAMYWPVYVGNFRQRSETNGCKLERDVHKYFASKGLPSFMVFRWKEDPFFNEYQQKVRIFDMLVYFGCEKDAIRAVEWCNRDLFHGYRLNVYCGRTPALFPKQESWRMTHLKEEDKLATEQSLEEYLRRYGNIHCITKQDLDGVLVQYGHTFHNGIETFAREERVKCSPIIGPVSKQRFVEQDVEEEILQTIEADPSFMEMQVGFRSWQWLKNGRIPPGPRYWEKSDAERARLRSLRAFGARYVEGMDNSNFDEMKALTALKEQLTQVRQIKRDQPSPKYEHRPQELSYNPRIGTQRPRKRRRTQWTRPDDGDNFRRNW